MKRNEKKIYVYNMLSLEYNIRIDHCDCYLVKRVKRHEVRMKYVKQTEYKNRYIRYKKPWAI